jgi:hypothetical protein
MQRELTPAQRRVWASLRWRARHRERYDAYRRATRREAMRKYRARKRQAAGTPKQATPA